jgi:hypothetical protein
MGFLKRVVPVILVAAVLMTAVVAPVSAGPETPAAPQAAAAPQVAALHLDVEPGLEATASAGKGGGAPQASFSVSRDVALQLPWGELKLSNARLQVELASDGAIERLRGTADMPFPTFGVLDDTRIVTPARADVGMEFGRNLRELNLELAPDRRYLFLNVDTAFGVSARAPGDGGELTLSLDPGQHLMLVIDTTEPVVHLDGQVTLSLDDQIALLGGTLEHTAIGPYVPDSLPIRQRSQFGVSGKFSKNLADSHLTLTGAYTMDSGLLPARLGIEAKPVQVRGTLTISRDGILAEGAVVSSIEPEHVLDGGASVRAFIPFREEAGEAYAHVKGKVTVPVAKLSADAGAQIDRTGYEVRGRLAAPFAPGELIGKTAGRIVLPDVIGAAKPVISKAAAGLAGFAQQSAERIEDAANAGKQRLNRGASVVAEAAK